MSRQKQFQFRLSEEDTRWLRERIESLGIPENDYLRRVVERAVHKMRQSPQVLAAWETLSPPSNSPEPGSPPSPTAASSGASTTSTPSSPTPSDSKQPSTNSGTSQRKTGSSKPSSDAGVCEHVWVERNLGYGTFEKCSKCDETGRRVR